MSWLLKYKVRHYIDNSMWIPAVMGMIAAIVGVRVVHAIDISSGLVSKMEPETARTVLSTLASSMFTFIVFVCTALLVAVQLASAQLTPRIIAIVFRSAVMRFSLAVFVFTFTFSVAALIRIHDTVPSLTVTVAAYSCVFSLAVFLVMIDGIGKALRPSGALRTVASLGQSVIDGVYPHRLGSNHDTAESDLSDFPKPGPSVTITSPKGGVVLAFDINGLVQLARQSNCIIEMIPQVGDQLSIGDPVFRVHGGNEVSAGELNQRFAVGLERTLEQDPTLAFRIMVDIASKGLSPAINDPTTAVLAVDQIHHLLRNVASRKLDTGHVHDANGTLRLVFQTPDWQDFVCLAVTEIRQFGGESIQIARRLRAMLENLIQNVPVSRKELLRQELILIHRSVERSFAEPEDRTLADESDPQGVGGGRSRK